MKKMNAELIDLGKGEYEVHLDGYRIGTVRKQGFCWSHKVFCRDRVEHGKVTQQDAVDALVRQFEKDPLLRETSSKRIKKS